MILANRGIATHLATTGSLRLDGRLFGDSREPFIEWLLSSPNESILRLSLGETKVHVKTTATLTSEEGSAIEGVGTGKYSISYHSLPCSFENESKSVTERDIHMTKLLASLFGRNAVIDLTTLLENDQVFSICTTVSLLQDDGNVIDASTLGILGSLFYFEFGSRTNKRLSLKYLPLTSTFCIFPDNRVLIDPSRLEEQISKYSLCTVCIDPTSKDMTALFKDGSPICTVTFTELAQLAYLQAIQRAQFIRQLNK